MLILVLLLAAVAQAQTPAEIGRQAVDLLLAEKYTELVAQFTPQMKMGLTEEALRSQIGPKFKSLGAPLEIGAATTQSAQTPGMTVATVPVRFKDIALNVVVTVNAESKIAGLFFRPRTEAQAAAPRPPYSKPESFTERQATVGTGEWALPATLTLPKIEGAAPGVVLVHGSGPQDRDETVGGVKVFRDLAEGLASRGIAVLRYEKRTKQYPAQVAAIKGLTVQQEVVEDAAAAAELLAKQPEVDAKRVFLLGHSLGAFLAPRIAAASGKLAGIVMLAANARPLEELMIEQITYLGSLSGGLTAPQRDLLEKLKAAQSAKTAAELGGPVAGMPPEYLFDLRSFDAVAAASKLSIPMLILQGARDYQVTMTDFKTWQAALGSQKNVTLKSYPTLNHLFVAGEGKGTPQEYLKPANVSGEVIEDIAKWIAR